MSEEKLNTKVVTGLKFPARGSYVNVYKPRLNDLNGKEEYSICLLIPKQDKETLAKLKEAMKNAIQIKWQGKPPKNLRNPLRDGDSDGDNGVPDSATAGEEPYGGHYFINAKNTRQPKVVGRDMNESIDPTDFVSGDYCRASISAFAYDTKGNKGVAFGLNHIQIVRKGEPLGSYSSPDDDFEKLEEAEDQDEGGSDDPFDI